MPPLTWSEIWNMKWEIIGTAVVLAAIVTWVASYYIDNKDKS